MIALALSNLQIVSHFTSADEAVEKLTAVGLNTTRVWLQPHHTLSTGGHANMPTALY